MSIASLLVMFASARMPQIVAPLLSLPVVIAAETWLTFQLISPVASGVRLEVCTDFEGPLTVAVTTLPPWNALAASMCVGVPVAFAVWQVTQASVARYLPLAWPL